MNRIEEYNQLIREAEPPENLSEALARSLNKSRRVRTGRRVALCACAPLAVLVVFTALVNLLPGFALACQKVPVIKDLAKAVSFSPSLSAAVDNGYVQRIDQAQTKDGITMRVEYVIADKKQWYVFYKLQQPSKKQRLSLNSDPKDISGSNLLGITTTSNASPDDNDDTLRSMTVFFVDRDAPDAIRLECKVYGEDPVDYSKAPQQGVIGDLATPPPQPDPIAYFSFDLGVDPTKLHQGDVYPQGKPFELDGQKLILKQVDVYPTHVLVSFEDDSANTAWLKGLIFYLQDENGVKYEHLSSGVVSMGRADSPMMSEYYIESPYFSECKKLTLHIDGATWLDKDRQRARIDLKNGYTEGLPDGVKLASATRQGNNWALEFQETDNSTLGGTFSWDYWDEQERSYRFTQSQSSSSEGYDGLPPMSKEWFVLKDYPGNIVYLGLSKTRTISEAQPIVIPVK